MESNDTKNMCNILVTMQIRIMHGYCNNILLICSALCRIYIFLIYIIAFTYRTTLQKKTGTEQLVTAAEQIGNSLIELRSYGKVTHEKKTTCRKGLIL